MSHYPFRRVLLGPVLTIAVAGKFLQVLSTKTGRLLKSVQTSSDSIRAVAATPDIARVVTTADDKVLRVWHIIPNDEDGVTVELESSREIPKKSSEIHITADLSTILASDKFGDVYTYPMEPPLAVASVPLPTSGRGQDEKPKHGTLVLGHTSVITAFTLTPLNDFIITGDRDEHIRVSWFPLGYNIERYCLGHRKYVSALHIPSFSPATLISGGGEPELILWDWKTGQLLLQIPVLDTVKPFVKVKGGRKSFKVFPRRPDGQGLSRKSRSAKKTKKAAAASSTGTREGSSTGVGRDQEDGAGQHENPADDVDMIDLGPAEEASGDVPLDPIPLPEKFDPSEESFVIGKIGSLSVGDRNLVLFSAVGVSALFYFPFPINPSQSATPIISTVDFGSPVLDFAVAVIDPGPEVWVSTDHSWKLAQAKADSMDEDQSPAPPMIRLLRYNDGELVELIEKVPALLTGLNSSLVEASQAAIAALELYAPLAMLPKSREEEAEDAGADHPEGERASPVQPSETEDRSTEGGKSTNRKAIKKIAGRADTKERLTKAKEQGIGAGLTALGSIADTSGSGPSAGEVSVAAKRAKVEDEVEG